MGVELAQYTTEVYQAIRDQERLTRAFQRYIAGKEMSLCRC